MPRTRRTTAAEATPTGLHPLVQATVIQLKAAKIDAFGAVWAGPGGLNVRVSPHGIERAAGLMDKLIQHLEKRGHTVKAGTHACGTIIMVRGEKISLQLSERISRYEHHESPNEQNTIERKEIAAIGGTRAAIANVIIRQSFMRRLWICSPTNQFTFKVLHPYTRQTTRLWKDKDGAPIESQIGSIVAKFENYPEIIAKMRRQDEEEALRREEEALRREGEKQRREEAERRKHYEKLRHEALERNAEQWERASRIRAYVAAVRTKAEAEGRAEAVPQWYEWALAFAESIDPITNGSGLP